MKLKLGLHSSRHSNCNLHSIQVQTGHRKLSFILANLNTHYSLWIHLIPNFHALLDHCMTQYHSFFNTVKKLNPSFICNLRSWVTFRWQTNLVYFSHSFWWWWRKWQHLEFCAVLEVMSKVYTMTHIKKKMSSKLIRNKENLTEKS